MAAVLRYLCQANLKQVGHKSKFCQKSQIFKTFSIHFSQKTRMEHFRNPPLSLEIE